MSLVTSGRTYSTRCRRHIPVRLAPDGRQLQTIGVAAVLSPTGGFVSLRIRDADHGVDGLQIRMGQSTVDALIAGLLDARTAVFGAPPPLGDISPAPRCEPPPGPVDHTYVAGEPWRRGLWTAPLPARGR